MDTTSIKTGDMVLTGVVIEGLTLNSISPVVSRKVDCWLWDDGSVILWDDGLYNYFSDIRINGLGIYAHR